MQQSSSKDDDEGSSLKPIRPRSSDDVNSRVVTRKKDSQLSPQYHHDLKRGLPSRLAVAPFLSDPGFVAPSSSRYGVSSNAGSRSSDKLPQSAPGSSRLLKLRNEVRSASHQDLHSANTGNSVEVVDGGSDGESSWRCRKCHSDNLSDSGFCGHCATMRGFSGDRDLGAQVIKVHRETSTHSAAVVRRGSRSSNNTGGGGGIARSR